MVIALASAMLGIPNVLVLSQCFPKNADIMPVIVALWPLARRYRGRQSVMHSTSKTCEKRRLCGTRGEMSLVILFRVLR